MKTFKIHNDDLVFDEQNNLVMVEGVDEVAQSIERTLTTNLNEWFLDIEFGLDYSAIIGKGKNIEDIRLSILDAIYQDERVSAVELEDIKISNDRKLTVNGTITDINDIEIPIMEVVEIG